MAKSFIWYELMTSDVPAAQAFYEAVIGWRPEAFPNSGGDYIVLNAGDRGIGGIMQMPEQVKAMGVGPMWVGYIHASDVDAATDSVMQAGGSVQQPPYDIPGVGRFSVVADPQGATFMLLQPTGADQPPVEPMTPGHVGWHELTTTDREEALAFYSSQFGWTKDEAVEMGDMGTYQMFAVDGVAVGGLMNTTPEMPAPFWQFIFNVPEIDAAVKRVVDNGGTIAMAPMEVPGGAYAAVALDPQGAIFGFTAMVR